MHKQTIADMIAGLTKKGGPLSANKKAPDLFRSDASGCFGEGELFGRGEGQYHRINSVNDAVFGPKVDRNDIGFAFQSIGQHAAVLKQHFALQGAKSFGSEHGF